MFHSGDQKNLFRSARAESGQDILLMGQRAEEGFKSRGHSDRNPLDLDNLKSYMGGVGNQEVSTREAIFGSPQNNQTMLERLMPNKSYKPQNINMGALTQKTAAPTKDGEHVRNVRQSAQNEVKELKGQVMDDLKQIKREADDALKESAMEAGENVGDVESTFSTNAPSTHLSAGVAIATDLCFAGAGTMVTILSQGGPAWAELSENEKKLPLDKQEAILDDVCQRLKSSGSNASANDANEGATVKFDVPEESEIAWENADADLLREIYAMNIEDPNIPELDELDEMDQALKDVEDDHKYADNRADVDHVAANAFSDDNDVQQGKIIVGDKQYSAKDSIMAAMGLDKDNTDAKLQMKNPYENQSPAMGMSSMFS